MSKAGSWRFQCLTLVVVILCAWSGSVFAAGAATPDLQAKADRVRAQMEQEVSNAERQAAADSLKALREQIHTYQLMQADPTQRTKGGSVTPQGVVGIDFKAVPTGPFDASGNPSIPDYNTTANWAFTPPIAKFVDTLSALSGVDASGNCVAPNNLGQCLPIGTPDTVTYPGSDYYEISLREWSEVMHSDMPSGTPTRGYIQTNDGTDQALVAGGCTAGATPSDNTCNTIAAPSRGHFLGPIIIAQRDRPVRIKFTNELPFDADGLANASGHRDGDLHVVRSPVGMFVDDFDPLVHRRPRWHRVHVGERLHDDFRRRVDNNFGRCLNGHCYSAAPEPPTPLTISRNPFTAASRTCSLCRRTINQGMGPAGSTVVSKRTRVLPTPSGLRLYSTCWPCCWDVPLAS